MTPADTILAAFRELGVRSAYLHSTEHGVSLDIHVTTEQKLREVCSTLGLDEPQPRDGKGVMWLSSHGKVGDSSVWATTMPVQIDTKEAA